jgi:DNA repair photolyase
MPGIITALAESGTPLSILTKGTLMLRDLPLLQAAARDVDVGLSMSIGFTDETLWRAVEPGTPSPSRRLDAVRTLAEAGLGCSVLMAPILPYLSDAPEQLRATVAAIAEAGASSVIPIVLHLRPGAREWYAQWLKSTYPRLVPRYRALYRNGSYAPAWYSERVVASVHAFAEEFGLRRPSDPAPPDATRRGPDPEAEPQRSGTWRSSGSQRAAQPSATQRSATQLSLWDETPGS